MKTEIGMMKINLKKSETVYKTMSVILALVLLNYVFSFLVPGSEGNTTVAGGNYLYLFPLLMAIFIPIQNFSKLMNLGGKRKEFFRSSILVYILLSGIVTLISIVLHVTLDRILLTKIAGVVDFLEVFGFWEHGVIVAFFQMWAFLIFFSCVIHTLTMIQGHWYGYVVDALLIIVVSVFVPIAPLRSILVWFFKMIIFHNVAIVQILSCLVLGGLIYWVSLVPIKSKGI